MKQLSKMQIFKKLKLEPFLIFLLLFSLFSKFFVTYPNIIPFSFDHGKDALNILFFAKTLTPPLIGPWTSIPGLFFGPGWYYLLMPAYLLGNANPIFSVWIMIMLNLLSIFLAYKYFGKIEATIIATTAAWNTVSISAWNPFPMPLIMLLILTILKNKQIKTRQLLFLGALISLEFHFSSAYAIFSLIGITIILLIRIYFKKLILNFTNIFNYSLGILIPFIPQVIFEIRHNFIESKAIYNYLTNPPSNQIKDSLNKIVISTLKEYRMVFSPDIHNAYLQNALLIILSIMIIWGFFIMLKKHTKVSYLNEVAFLIIFPVIGFSFIHFNIWYIYATFPVILIFLSQFIKKMPQKFQIFLIFILIISQTANLYYFNSVGRQKLIESKNFLPAKLKSINTIRYLSKNKSFSSYHYEPDIYDFPYQYIYIYQAMHGQKLPIEFSYQPEKQDYIAHKQELIKNLPRFKQEKPEYIFYIVEKPQYPDLLKNWWNQQNYKKIIKEVKITPDLTVYQALPKTSI